MMNQLLAEGDRVYIEFCILCEQHQWCTKHSSLKYLNYFNLCNLHPGKKELQRFRPDLKVYSNEIPPKLASKYHIPDGDKRVVAGKLSFPRIGAFEVYYRGVVVFSKLKSGLWPRPDIVCENVKKVQEEEERKEVERERRRGKRGKNKRRRRKKSGVQRSARTSPSRTMKSTQETFQHSSQRPSTSNPRARSTKRSHSPKSVKDSSGDYSHVYVKHSFSSEESPKHYHDEGIQADRFASGELQLYNDQKFTEEVKVEPVMRWPEEEKKQEERQPEADKKTDEKKPWERTVEIGRTSLEKAAEDSRKSWDQRSEVEKKPLLQPADVVNKAPEPVAEEVKKQPEKVSEEDPVRPPLERPKTAKRPIEQPTEAAKRDPSPIKVLAIHPENDTPPPVSNPLPQNSVEEGKAAELKEIKSKEEERYSDEKYESGEFDEEEEPTHPLRPVTKSYNVEIPMGKYTNKKINYTNESGEDATFALISSHPQEMQAKDKELSIPDGEKGALKLQFTPVYEECEKRFYLYLDKDYEPVECFEFVVKYT